MFSLKYVVLFGLLEVLLISTNVKMEDCFKLPSIIMDSALDCYDKIKTDHKIEVDNPNTNYTDVKCYSLCVHKVLGYFKNGEYSVTAMRTFADTYVLNKTKADQLYNMNVEATEKAKNVVGDDCEKAHAFFKVTLEHEKSRRFITKLFCPPESKNN